MQCTKPITIYPDKDSAIHKKYPDGLQVPCGKCLACRIKKRKEWSLRMLHELNYHDQNSFVTLTYRDEELPANKSLIKSDLQKFFKRLRKNLDQNKIKYFACGEYGEESRLIYLYGRPYKTQGDRPHYHAIIFGLGIREDDRSIVERSWTLGDVHFGLAEPDSINYVAGYIDKKYSGDKAEEEYYQKNREPVFRILSNGIGLNYVTDNAKKIIDNKHVSMWGQKLALPRYYIKKLEAEGYDVEELKEHAYAQECDLVSHYTGYDYSLAEAYRVLDAERNSNMIEAIKKAKAQHEANLTQKSNLHSKKL